ncbi:MAG: hypothetical protein ACTSWQ_03610 [Candidatus Thorarchaeota archaeon]
MTRKFIVDYSIYGEEDITQAVIELDDEVIDRVDDEWRAGLYNLNTPEEIAVHICYNMVENRLGLSSLDGWADLDDSMAKMLEWPEISFDMTAREIK